MTTEHAGIEADVWALQEVAEAAREVPYEHQPERLRLALARLIQLQPPWPTTNAAGPADRLR